MRKESEIVSIHYNEIPNEFMSYKLLDEICKRMKPSLSDISRKIDKPVILYGAGNFGKMAKEYFDKLEITFLCVVDKNPEKYSEDSFWFDIDIFKSSDLTIQWKERCLLVICVATTSYNEVFSQLKSEGWKDIVPFYDITLAYQDKHPLNNGWISGLIREKDSGRMEFVLTNLEDDISCAHYLQFIAWHSLHEEWIFTPLSNENRYFIPEIINVLRDNETFIDIGAHYGKVTKRFIETVDKKFNSVYMIEPDVRNLNKLINNTYFYMDHYNVDILSFALGNVEGVSDFYHGLGYSSQLSKLSNEETTVKKLDNLNLTPSFIKIHTEGNEDDVIKGGIKTIKKYRPIIVTTCYHNRKGLCELPMQLMNELENYKFYFRLHSWYGTGAVIYCIPKER